MSTQNTAQENPLLASQTQMSLGDYIQSYINRVRAGDLGSLPIILGLILIAIIFQSQNENFLTSRNFVNLIVQMAGITTIAYGVVYVLLLGEIDLSVGFVSAVAAVSMTLLLREPDGWPWYAAMGVALLGAAGIGLLHGLVITTFQVPSFVVTLAGLLAWNGVVLILVGGAGTVIIQDDVIIGLANYFLPPLWGWIVAALFVGGFALNNIMRIRARQSQGLSTTPFSVVLIQVVALGVIVGLAVLVAKQDRGVPFVGVLLLLFLGGLTF